MEVRGIEPRSVSRPVSLSFTCVVAVSPATEFVDSANDLSPCFSHLRPGSPRRRPDLVVYNPTRYQDYLTGDRLLLIRQRQREHCRLQLCFSRLIKAGREPLARKRSFHPTSKPITPIGEPESYTLAELKSNHFDQRNRAPKFCRGALIVAKKNRFEIWLQPKPGSRLAFPQHRRDTLIGVLSASR